MLDVGTGIAADEDALGQVHRPRLGWRGRFLYSRFPKPPRAQDFQALNYDQAIYLHRLGTRRARTSWSTPTPSTKDTALGQRDERRALGDRDQLGRHRCALRNPGHRPRRPRHEGWTTRELVTGFDNAWSVVDGVGGTQRFPTNKDAPRYKVDLDRPRQARRRPGARGDGRAGAADRRCLDHREPPDRRLPQGCQRAWRGRSTLPARTQAPIALAGIGSVVGLHRRTRRSGNLLQLHQLQPPGDRSTGSTSRPATTSVFAGPEAGVRSRRYRGRAALLYLEGRHPRAGVRRAAQGRDRPGAPTLLYAYGGFDISLTPGFSPSRLAWMEAGGVFALANIRGGGEYGKAWHDGGRLANKQNVFDDFIAAGEFLKARRHHRRRRARDQGGSNGGLLVGAVVNQRPDLFAAAMPPVGRDGHAALRPLDGRPLLGRRLRLSATAEADFSVLRAYSPYAQHRAAARPIRRLIVTTADTDDRVVPGAQLQIHRCAAGGGPSERTAATLIRIEAARGPRLGQADRQSDRGSGGLADRLPGLDRARDARRCSACRVFS